MDVVVTFLLQNLEFKCGQHEGVDHSLDDLDSRHVLAVERVLDLQDVVLVLELVDDPIHLSSAGDGHPAAQQVLEVVEALLGASSPRRVPFDLLQRSCLQFQLRGVLQINFQGSFQVLKVFFDLPFPLRNFLLYFPQGHFVVVRWIEDALAKFSHGPTLFLLV
jgi:hypothetical protein